MIHNFKGMYFYLPVAAFVMLVVYFFVYLPQHGRLYSKTREIQHISGQIEQLGSVVKDVDDLEIEIEKINGQLEVYEQKFRSEEEMPKIIQSLSKMFLANRLIMMSILPKETRPVEVPGQNIMQVTLAVELAGGFWNLIGLMRDINRNPNAVVVQDLEIIRSDIYSGELVIKVLINVFLKKKQMIL